MTIKTLYVGVVSTLLFLLPISISPVFAVGNCTPPDIVITNNVQASTLTITDGIGNPIPSNNVICASAPWTLSVTLKSINPGGSRDLLFLDYLSGPGSIASDNPALGCGDGLCDPGEVLFTEGGSTQSTEFTFPLMGEYNFKFRGVGAAADGSPIELTVFASVFVVPETPIGIVALLGSSLAALGGFMFWKRKHSNNQPHSLGDLGI